MAMGRGWVREGGGGRAREEGEGPGFPSKVRVNVHWLDRRERGSGHPPGRSSGFLVGGVEGGGCW